MYKYVPVHTGTYLYVLYMIFLYLLMTFHAVPVWEFWYYLTVLFQFRESCTCLYCLVPNLTYVVLAGTVLYRLLPIGEILYLLVPSCTKLRNLVLPCTILYCLVPILGIWYLLVLSCSKATISCTCWYRLVPSCTNRGNLVLAGTGLFQTKKSGTILYHLVPPCTTLYCAGTRQYIPVHTSMYCHRN